MKVDDEVELFKGGLGGMGVGQMWMAATPSDHDNTRPPGSDLGTRRDLALTDEETVVEDDVKLELRKL